MKLKIISKGLPEEVKEQLLSKENAYYFSFITYKGGCFSSSSRKDYWIAITNKRVLYKAKVIEDQNSIEKDGVLPLEKVSFIEVTNSTENEGCSSAQSFNLKISTSGGKVLIPIPTKEKGHEIRKIFTELHESKNVKE